jgi:ATP-dependent exoDNAse (exonuclease V) alpha subunit
MSCGLWPKVHLTARVAVLEQRADAVLRQEFAVHVGEDQLKHPRYSTRVLLRVEEGLVQSLNDRRGTWRPYTAESAVDAALAARPTIGEDQSRVVRRLTLSPDGIDIVRAPAGTGKTFALDAAREAWEAVGHEVFGCALSARAALELEDQAGIASTTIARLLHHDDESTAFPAMACLWSTRPAWSAPAPVLG